MTRVVNPKIVASLFFLSTALLGCSKTAPPSGGGQVPDAPEAPAATESQPGSPGEARSAAAPAPASEPEPEPEPSPPGGIRLAEGQKKTHDFGVLTEGESALASFELVSDGEGPLVIEKVRPTCGCTVATTWIRGDGEEWTSYEMGTPIPSGSRIRLDTKLYTEGKLGSLGVSILMSSNAVAPVSLRVQAEVEPILLVLPDRKVPFGQFDRSKGAERELDIRTRSGGPVLLTTRSIPDGVTLELTAVDPDDDGRSSTWKARLALGPDLPDGDRNYSCPVFADIELADPKQPNVDGSPKYLMTVLVAEVLGAVEVQPNFIGFGKVVAGEESERTVRIASRDGAALDPEAPVVIEGLVGEPFEHAESFEATVESVEDGKALEIRLRLLGLPEGAAGSFMGRLRVGIGHPDQATSSVRFWVECISG